MQSVERFSVPAYVFLCGALVVGCVFVACGDDGETSAASDLGTDTGVDAAADTAADTTADTVVDDVSNPDMETQGGDVGGPDLGVDVEPDAPQTTPACPVDAYLPCGGDLLGTWNIMNWCPDDPELAATHCEHPFDDRPACVGGGNGQTCNSITSGTATFGEDGVFAMDRRADMYLEYRFDEGCLATIHPGKTAEAACDEMASNGRLECGFEAGVCTCTAHIAEEDLSDIPLETVYADYEVVDDHRVLFSTDGRVRFEATYCVLEDRLTMDVTPHEDVWRYWVLQR